MHLYIFWLMRNAHPGFGVNFSTSNFSTLAEVYVNEQLILLPCSFLRLSLSLTSDFCSLWVKSGYIRA